MSQPLPFKLSEPFEFASAPIAPDKLIDGNPNAQLDHRFSDASGQFHTGIWRSEPGTWRVQYQESEVCVLLHGEVALSSVCGTTLTFSAPDVFVIPSGFSGTWCTLKRVTKIYVIFEANHSAG
jgi:uncharacterized protein